METVLVKEGDEVKVNQPLMIVEAMKMETTFVSKVNGKVDKLYVAPATGSTRKICWFPSFWMKRNNPLNTPKIPLAQVSEGNFFLFIFLFSLGKKF